MGQVVLNVDEDVATWSTDIAAGAGLHLPIGNYGGAIYRSAIRFNAPAGWQDWTGITKATLSFYISDFNHVAPRNSSIYVRRQSTGNPVWTKAAGTQNCESGFSGGNNTQYQDVQGVTTDQITFSSGTTANVKKTVTVTAFAQYYHNNNTTKLVFVFERVNTGDYSELWSESKTGGYDATLTIDYEEQSPPTQPTQVGPTHGSTVLGTNPYFDWQQNDPQGDPQASAEVRLWDAAGTGLLYTWSHSGNITALACPVALTRGVAYHWDVRTNDGQSAIGGGWSPWSGKSWFYIQANPTVTMDATRYMEMSNGAPRLRVKWTCDQPQAQYRVTASGYDSGWIGGSAQEHLLSTLNLTDNVAVSVAVEVQTTDALYGSHARAFMPRYGLTAHRKDLVTVPSAWGTPSVMASVPAGAQLVIEYGSNNAAAAAPTSGIWYSSLGAVPRDRYLFWRAWFIPSASAGPTLDAITIPSSYSSVAPAVDKWGTDLASASGMADGWFIDDSEYVYGSRSVSVVANGAAKILYSAKIRVHAGRSYILTGLMKTQGNPGARINVIAADWSKNFGGTENVTETRDWFQGAGVRDVYRYKTDYWVAPLDQEVVVILIVDGPSGQAWFDAIKLEESTVATPWSPGAVGASVVDAGGVQIDARRGGVFRYRASGSDIRRVVEGGSGGLVFGGDTEVYSPSAGTFAIESGLAGATVPGTLSIAGSSSPEGAEIVLGGGGGEQSMSIDVINGGQLRVHTAGAGDIFNLNRVTRSLSIGWLHPRGIRHPNGAAAPTYYRVATGTLPGQYTWQALLCDITSRGDVCEVMAYLNADAGVTVQPGVALKVRHYFGAMVVRLAVTGTNPIVWQLWAKASREYAEVQVVPRVAYGTDYLSPPIFDHTEVIEAGTPPGFLYAPT